jgi:hypothetical protein
MPDAVHARTAVDEQAHSHKAYDVLTIPVFDRYVQNHELRVRFQDRRLLARNRNAANQDRRCDERDASTAHIRVTPCEECGRTALLHRCLR